MLVDLNLVESLKKNKMVEVIHKGRTTTWMTNIAIPIIKELNPLRKEWSMVQPLYDTWIHNRSQNKEVTLEIGGMNFPRLTLVLSVSASPIYGVPRFLQCTGGLSQVVLRELVQQAISVPNDPSSVENEAKSNVNGILRAKVKQEGVHINVSQVKNKMPNVPVVPEATLYVCPKIKE